MATKVTVEFVTIGVGPGADGSIGNVVKTIEGAALTISATGTSAQSGAAPTPAAALPYNSLYARITAYDGNIRALVAANPTVSQTTGLGIPSGATELLAIAAGQKVAVIELA